MDCDVGESYEDLYDEKDSSRHDKLVQKVLRLNKTQHLKKPARTEPTLQISEFNLVKSITGKKGSVQINNLTKVLKNKKSALKIGENVTRLQKKSHTLPKPLEKPQANRIRRGVAYEKTRLALDRWDATVTANRVSTNLRFPLKNDFNIDKKEANNFTKMWRLKSKLQEELEKLEPKVEEYNINLEQEKFPLNMDEMLVRRSEAAKLRAYQGYQEAKARRQNKIKSKKFHRIQKKERIKKKLKEFEQLQKTNPEEALKKLEEIEKSRAHERFSLRHKSTGKWARNQQIRAKYDKESRQNLAQQLTISRDLTQKTKTANSDSEEGIAEVANPSNDEDNIWLNGVKPDKEVSNFISGYRKFWSEQNKNNDDAAQEAKVVTESMEIPNEIQQTTESNGLTDRHTEHKITLDETSLKKKRKKEKKVKPKTKLELHMLKNYEKNAKLNSMSTSNDNSDLEVAFEKAEKIHQAKLTKSANQLKKQLGVRPNKVKVTNNVKIKTNATDLSMPLQKRTPQIDDELSETTHRESEGVNQDSDLLNLQKIISSNTKQAESNIDPEKYLKVKSTSLSTAIPDLLTEENEEVDQRAVISEAFEDDDIVDEFNKDKQDEIDKDKPKDVDLNLPGWGSWGGTNIKPHRRLKKRFLVKAPETVPRRDDNRGNLIINESAQSKIKEHIVSEVPFPFKTVKDFEASMRAPISNTFVPETAYRKLIKPAVTTKMGAIIEPISKDILLSKK